MLRSERVARLPRSNSNKPAVGEDRTSLKPSSKNSQAVVKKYLFSKPSKCSPFGAAAYDKRAITGRGTHLATRSSYLPPSATVNESAGPPLLPPRVEPCMSVASHIKLHRV